MTIATTAPRPSTVTSVIVGGGVLLTFFATDTALCPTRICTGHACPGCGMTRAIIHGVRGDFGESWRHHPLAGLVVLQLVVWLALRRFAPDTLTPRLAQIAVIANAALLAVVWVIRWRLGLLDYILT